MICSDDLLAALDRDMASLYRDAMDQGDWETRAILQDTRDRFLSRRERCAAPGCVVAVYQDRIDEIDRVAAGR